MSGLISRADAIERIANDNVVGGMDRINEYRNSNEHNDYLDGISTAIATIDDIPSAEAVPRLKQTDTLIIADALRYLAKDTERHLVDRTRADALRQQFLKYGASMCSSADAVQGYTEWLEKIIVDNEGANEWLCEDTPDLEWCEKNCHYSSIQAECLRHLYEVSKGGARMEANE